jgi:sporulation protein YlmC with PRC-barrel domain
MLFNLSTIRGHAVAASDGTIGTVSDFLFDDTSWMIRWLVVDTGNWLSGRKVLLPPSVLGHAEPSETTFPVHLTRAEVEASPELDTHVPVSRQFETYIYDYYGWSPYWGSGDHLGGYGLLGNPMPMLSDPEVQRRVDDISRQQQSADAPHLRSAVAVTGYHIHATDGEIGHLSDIMVEDTDWRVHYLVVDTSNWWNGKLVLISPHSARDIRWTERLIYLDVDRQKVNDSPPYNSAKPIDRDQERQTTGHNETARTDPMAEPRKAG